MSKLLSTCSRGGIGRRKGLKILTQNSQKSTKPGIPRITALEIPETDEAVKVLIVTKSSQPKFIAQNGWAMPCWNAAEAVL